MSRSCSGRWSAWRSRCARWARTCARRRQAADRDRRRTAPARHRLPHAGGERPGEIRRAARGTLRRGRHRPCSRPRHAAITASGCCRARACGSRRRASPPRFIRRRGSRASRSRSRAISPPPPFSSSQACSEPRPEGLLLDERGVNPTRTGLLDILRSMGGRIEIENRALERRRARGGSAGAPLGAEGIEVPAGRGAARHRRISRAVHRGGLRARADPHHGREELRVKESDRIAAMAAGFDALGVEHEATPDGMCIEGRPTGAAFRGGEIDSRGDHRIAMAFSIASLRAAKPIAVRDTANVATSFPGFVALARAGGLDLAESVGGPR